MIKNYDACFLKFLILGLVMLSLSACVSYRSTFFSNHLLRPFQEVERNMGDNMIAEVHNLDKVILDCCSQKLEIIEFIESQNFNIELERNRVANEADIIAYKHNNNLFLDKTYWIYITLDKDTFKSVRGRIISDITWF